MADVSLDLAKCSQSTADNGILDPDRDIKDMEL